ncbi:MAG: undecaprenyl-diphosphate phosphatase [Piscirickettsiaceae bacterium]|nr:undecaprenyl-diphosphate phosphatase [Piscirickettsiaceae bacterium]
MELSQAITLGISQGLTEFLPISSSAHLILLPIIMDWQDQGLAFDVAVHVGTLISIIIYFRQTLRKLLADWIYSIYFRQIIDKGKLVWDIIIGTIPVGLIALSINHYYELHLRGPLIIAIATIIFGLLLGCADWYGKQQRNEYQLKLKDIIILGFAEAIALIPGTSRSGITITAGLILGLSRSSSARFSFLLSIPVITLAGGLKIFHLIYVESNTDWFALILGALLSFISSYLCIHLFLKSIERIGMWPFVIYRLILGVLLIRFNI